MAVLTLFDSRWIGTHGIGRFAAELLSRAPDFRPIALRGRPSAALDPWRLGAYLRREKPDFFLSPGYNAPAGTCGRFGFTVHDLIHLATPDNANVFKRLYYREVIRPAVRRASIVFTVSEFSRREICEWAGVNGACQGSCRLSHAADRVL